MYLLVFDTLSLSLELTSLMLTFSFTHTLFQQYTVIYFSLFVRIIINLSSTIYTTNYNYKTTLHSKWFLSHHFDKMWDNKMSKVNSDKKDPYEFRYYP